MRAIVQRVSRASVSVDGETKSLIGKGFMVLLGAGRGDTAQDVDYICRKLRDLRIFDDPEGKMNLGIADVAGEVLLVSQFTLYGDARKGRRPSFSEAEEPVAGLKSFELVVETLRKMGLKVQTGIFGAHMNVELVNDGPVTILMDSRKLF
ncbi:MAG: D-tyrosyl-tRNA(Tyr) deacylase [Candidatus Wallbacteria bacterium HGW-Wallbacteria-1]|uniref:D-aminoacyl-tRNA deacylase n=1 Tax=Candidatus Wallbacteria bacterium HGW-Wallbacteria-1 TaxID=2013854 RepID=A0A2N1PS17_9BACT|nr:MAG: D-tyrosyl-tRNA(Tyr) deacylase [Candidatus Wallbacteria bacterium HGW-Wallbacteria-1]